MSKYPDVIDLSQYDNISDAEIVRDIADTEREIADYERLEVAEREIAATHPNPMERRMADFKAGARPHQQQERRDFVGFLQRIQSARASRAPHGTEGRDDG